MSNFRTIDRGTGFLLPPSVDEWLPEKHLARCRRDCRCTGFARAERRLSRLGFEVLSPAASDERSVLRLCDGRVFEPQAGAGDLRFGGVPLYSGQRPSRSRHDRRVSTTVSAGDRKAVRANPAAGGLANLFSRGTPYNSALVTGCVLVVIASAAMVVWFMRYRKPAGPAAPSRQPPKTTA